MAEGEPDFLGKNVLERNTLNAITSSFVADNPSILLPLALRARPGPAFWETAEGKSYNIFTEPLQCLIGLTDLMKFFCGDDIVRCLQSQYGSLRDVVEKSTPTTQCNNVIDPPKDCWICGGPITEEANFTPECEHIFPIAQALVFTGLYEHNLFERLSDNIGGDLSRAYIEGLKLEYKWAHRICNQVKNDTHFIDFNGKTFTISATKVNAFLDELLTTKNWGGGLALSRLLGITTKNKSDWYSTRTSAIFDICLRIIKQVDELGLNPVEHAKCTALYLKEYLARDPKCGKQEEVARTKPTASTGPLSTITKESTTKVFNFIIDTYLPILSNSLFGCIHEEIRPLLIEIGENAQSRALRKIEISDIELSYKKKLKEKIGTNLQSLRWKLAVYLQRKKIYTDEQLWSRYQVLSSQILGLICVKFACNDFEELIKEGDSKIKNIILENIVPGFKFQIKKEQLIKLYTEKIYYVFFDTRESKTPEVIRDLILKEIDEILKIEYTSTNAELPKWLEPAGGGKRKTQSKRLKRKAKLHRKRENRHTRSKKH